MNHVIPLYLHQNDHPGMILINKQLIGSVALRNELFEHYSQLDGHKIFTLTNELVNLKQQNSSIEVYYLNFKGLWDELDALEAPNVCVCKCDCENGKKKGEREQRKRLIQFLMGLDESYTNIRGQLLLIQRLPPVAKAYSMLRLEEKQRENPKAPVTIPMALYMNASSKPS